MAAVSPRRSTPRAMAALAFVALGGSIVTASCRDVVAGNADDVLAKLCDTLKPCYGGDPSVISCADLQARWADADAATSRDFLLSVAATNCFDTCPHALGCTDNPPFCLDSGSCDGRSDCCGWSFGSRDCVAVSGGEPTCCLSEGRPCDLDNDSCCNRDCRGAEGASYCGGTACTEVGDACKSSFDCCTHRCVLGACEKLTECSRQDEPCGNDDDCCTDTSVGPSANVGKLSCDHGTCRPAASCGSGDTCDPSDSCCGDNLLCYPLAVGGVCGDPTCVPLDADCESDLDCCGTSVCSYTPTPHCQLSLSTNSQCVKTGASCGPASTANSCCSLSCGPDDKCREFSEAPCGANSSCHSVCEIGGPMSASCASGETSSCIGNVVMNDSVCACEIWDATCVAEYIAAGCACPAPTP